MLIQKGADVNARNRDNATPLHYIVKKQYREEEKELLLTLLKVVVSTFFFECFRDSLADISCSLW
jgi:hypothetical protein